jgi:hypothetical protein
MTRDRHGRRDRVVAVAGDPVYVDKSAVNEKQELNDEEPEYENSDFRRYRFFAFFPE